MKLSELKNKILTDVNAFDKFLRDNFCFENVRILHDDNIDYTKSMAIDSDDEFIAITLHDCAEIQDFIFISTDAGDNNDKEYEWQGITLYMHQYIDEMD
jgi:hypothetical protein